MPRKKEKLIREIQDFVRPTELRKVTIDSLFKVPNEYLQDIKNVFKRRKR